MKKFNFLLFVFFIPFFSQADQLSEAMKAYKEAKYKTAQELFESQSLNDADSQLAFEVTKTILSGSKKPLDSIKEPNDNLILKIGFGQLVHNYPQSAAYWFSQVKHESDLSLAGRAYIAFVAKSYLEFLSLYGKLSDRYRRLEGFEALAIQSWFGQGDLKKGYLELEKLMRLNGNGANFEIPVYFQQFLVQKLRHWNRYFVAALYYKIILKDNEEALGYLELIDQPDLETQLEKASVLIALKRYYESYRLLDFILEQPLDDSVKKNGYLLLGKTYSSLGLDEDAAVAYQKSSINQLDYARVLIGSRLYDTAYIQLEKLPEWEKSSFDYTELYLKSLLGTGQYDRANAFVKKWLLQKRKLAEKLKVAKLIWPTQNLKLIENIVAEVPEKTNLSLEENIALIDLQKTLGLYAQANALVGVNERQLMRDPDGLMVMAELKLAQSQKQQALELAELAQDLDEYKHQAKSFIFLHNRSLEATVHRINRFEDSLKQISNSVSIQLRLAADLINRVVQSYFLGQEKNVKGLLEAKKILNRLEQEYSIFPMVDFLLGKISFIQDKNALAVQFFESAIKKDLSFVEAYRYLALCTENLSEQYLILEKALVFAPGDGAIWADLGDILKGQNKINLAKQAYQKSIYFTPYESGAYLSLAAIYLSEQKPEKTFDLANQVLGFSTENPDALELLLRAVNDPFFAEYLNDEKKLKRLQIDSYDRLKAQNPDRAEKIVPIAP